MVNAELDADARKVLDGAHFPASEDADAIVAVDGDAILFLGVLRKPHTAWLDRPAQRGFGGAVIFGPLKVVVVDGFEAIEPDGLHDPA